MTEPTEKDVLDLNDAITRFQDSDDLGLRFIPLDIQTTNMSVSVDAGYAPNNDSTSQLGFLILLVDVNGNCNVLHFGSIKSRRMTRSVLAAERFSLVQGSDVGSTIRLDVDNIFGRIVPIKFCTDSKSLFDCLKTLAHLRRSNH